ncbi:MAG: aminotransferase class V-fold PLP-dependent enzyme [Clostridia bacterium]|nr:aminotransferase class V-fold PLP-dependent enzyme [Clostridia bacterium]
MTALKTLGEKVFGDIRSELSAIENIIFVTPYSGAPHILTVALPVVRGEVMQHSLEKHGIIIGTGSACSSKKGVRRIPHSIGLPDNYQEGIIRLSIGATNTEQDGMAAAKAICEEYKILSAYMRG